MIRSKSTCIRQVNLPNNKIDICKYQIWKTTLGTLNRVNLPCLIHDTRLCKNDNS